MELDYVQINAQALEVTDRFRNSNDLSEFNGSAGREHYKLLAYLAAQWNDSVIIDIGTHTGGSALALALGNRSNKVITFDIVDKQPIDRQRKFAGLPIEFNIDDIFSEEGFSKWQTCILDSALIVCDIDPHEGFLEFELYQRLKRYNYKGLLFFDDIWYFKGMRDNCWSHIPCVEKIDCTKVGHWSGTGIVHFGRDIVVKMPYPPRIGKGNSWTFVTAYFDLTKRPDASSEIKARPQSYYLSHANMTMSLEVNLIVYCDQASLEALQSLRPAHLRDQTVYRVMEFSDIELVKAHYEQIAATRREKGTYDPRNTASYYLLCMARYECLLHAMEENPFGSTHFGWCNICIERMHWKSAAVLPEILREFRDKFSTCYIDYQTMAKARNLADHFKPPHCSMCSGFFTGNLYHLSTFCHKIIEKFQSMAALQLGHADEQLFSLVFFENPWLFEFYLGDYREMVVNYGYLYERPEQPVRNVLRNLHRSNENPELLQQLCDRWLESDRYQTFTCDPALREQVQRYRTPSSATTKTTTTIVSACVLLGDRRDYAALSQALLQVDQPKVLFLDAAIRSHLRIGDGLIDRNTYVIAFEQCDLSVFKYCSNLANVRINPSSNPSKDTREYLAVIANKTQWVRMAAELDIFKTEHFIWVDFGLAHLFSNNNTHFAACVEKVGTYSKVLRIASIWDMQQLPKQHFMDRAQPWWFFAGGVFGGDRETVKKFDDLFQECLSRLLSLNLLTWEVNIYYLIYQQHPTLFSPYQTDHDPSILTLY